MQTQQSQFPIRQPSWILSIAIFVAAIALMAYLRLYVFSSHVIPLTYGLPLLVCLWHRDVRLLWAMVITFLGMAAYKIFAILPSPGFGELERWMRFSMQSANILVIGGAVHAVLHLTDRLRAKNAELEDANEELATRAEEISQQNEELAQQNEEIQTQSEELTQQNEELQCQSEELQSQAEELQVQTEELQTLNTELNHRETMLQVLLNSVHSTDREQPVLERICQSILDLFEPAAAANIVEKVDDDLVVRADEGRFNLTNQHLPFENSFAAVVMQEGKTAYVEDLTLRPDLVLPRPNGRAFRSVLGTPLRINGSIAGVIKVFALQPQRWTSRHFRMIEWIAAQCSLILETRRLRDELAHANVGLEKVVQERTAKLRDLINELEHFSYSITHDMRAPLRAMQGYAALLEEECKVLPNGNNKDYLRRIKNAASRMDRLITDALHFSGAMQQEMALSPVDPALLLQGMIESYPVFQRPQAEIEIDGALPLVLANEAGLLQCFSNLLHNAVKFVEPGRQPRIKVHADKQDGTVRLWFEDNGIGIPPQMQPRIFGMFQRANKEYEGTGIGLALVRKTAQRMAGSVGFESEPGKGSRFWLELQRP
jgi:signal transduction histidine kinase